jgi:Fur family peroxide stress response transcriptional regulator
MKKTERKTKQKQAVEDYLSKTYSHPTAEEVYNNVRKEQPKISKATVYRILRNFKKKGEVQEIQDDVSRWDYNEKAHPHFLCKKCKKIYDIEEKVQLPEKKKFKIGNAESYKIIFSGVCKNCKSKVEVKKIN